MIARLWRGLVRTDCVDSYVEHLKQETFPALSATRGFLRATILRRHSDRGVEFLIVTEWDSEASIAAFAGDDVQVAVVPDSVQRMMVEFDDTTRHYEVVE